MLGDELLNTSPLKMGGNVEYATYNRYRPHDFRPVLMISKKEVHYVYMFSGILVFITIEFTWSHRTRCLHYLYSLDFLNICWRVSLWSILGDLHVCLFAKRSGSRRETPSESGRLHHFVCLFHTNTNIFKNIHPEMWFLYLLRKGS